MFNSLLTREAGWIGVLLVACCVVACKQSAHAFKSTDVTGADFARDFQLTDHTGKLRSLADFRGKAVVVFFGYMHCPDYCPTTLSQLAKAVGALGEGGKRVQVLFVTVDPERDKPDLLSQYVTSFNASFLGMGASDAEVSTVAKEFRALYEKVPGTTPGQYTMNHSTGTYVFDASGHLRLYIAYGTDTEFLIHDLALLLKSV